MLRDGWPRTALRWAYPAGRRAHHPRRRRPRRPDGDASYAFYLSGTASAALDYAVLAAALPHGVTAVHAGTLSLVMEPIASAIERLITDGLPPDALVMVDPNCRPAAIGDRDAYLDRFERILHRADVVKVSVEDLDYLCPGVPAEVAATTLLGDRPALVLVTDGPRPARAFLSGVSARPAARSVSRCRGSRWWTRSARGTRSAADSSLGGRRRGWAGRN